MDIIKQPKHGDKIDARDSMYPSLLECVAKFSHLRLSGDGAPRTTYGFVLSGLATLEVPYAKKQDLGGLKVQLQEGAYFAVPGEFKIAPKAGRIKTAQAEGGEPGDPEGDLHEPMVVLIHRFGFKGQLSIGRMEKKGRLSYIDGCSDTMLVYPPRMGDPVFNHLHFPPGILQTQHTHPSIRLGIVARGSGISFGPKKLGEPEMWEHELSQGCVFMLHEQEMHSFQTVKSGEPMDVIAYHPDSDWGPTDANHPMLNRTYIGNVR